MTHYLERVLRTVRFPPNLYEQLRQSARDNSRTINGEIIHRLTRSFEGYRKL